MFSEEEYKALINPMQHKPTVPENQRFGVHFDYTDLCGRLTNLRERLEKQTPSEPSKLPSLRVRPFDPSPLPAQPIPRSSSFTKRSVRKSQSSLSPLKPSLSHGKQRLLRREQSNREVRLPIFGKPTLRRMRQREAALLG